MSTDSGAGRGEVWLLGSGRQVPRTLLLKEC
nr:MAG TPA: hypothetical protein [Caudoviricetes sp.]